MTSGGRWVFDTVSPPKLVETVANMSMVWRPWAALCCLRQVPRVARTSWGTLRSDIPYRERAEPAARPHTARVQRTPRLHTSDTARPGRPLAPPKITLHLAWSWPRPKQSPNRCPCIAHSSWSTLRVSLPTAGGGRNPPHGRPRSLWVARNPNLKQNAIWWRKPKLAHLPDCECLSRFSARSGLQVFPSPF